MPRNGSGTYSLPSTSVTPAVGSTLISSAAQNTFTSDIAAALTQSVSKDGQTVITGDFDFDGNAIILDGDGDTTIKSTTDDRIDFATGTIDRLSIDSSGFLDANKNEVISITSTASAVNEITIANSATGNDPSFSATGDDVNIGLNFITKGSGTLKFNGNAFIIESGTKMLFQQTAAPTGWTKETTHNDKALRVVSGTASSGGSVAFSTVFGRTATDAHTLTVSQIPSHTHVQRIDTTASGATSDWYTHNGVGGANPAFFSGQLTANTAKINTASAGSGSSHSHNMDLQVNYVDVIIASKD